MDVPSISSQYCFEHGFNVNWKISTDNKSLNKLNWPTSICEVCELSLARLQTFEEELAKLAWQTPLWGCSHTQPWVQYEQGQPGILPSLSTRLLRVTSNKNHNPRKTPSDKKYVAEKERRRKNNNPKNSGHFIPQQRLRLAHALCLDQNLTNISMQELEWKPSTHQLP